MSYDISFKVKVQDADVYVPVGECNANITWNVRDMIRAATGLEWKNEANNGLCINVMPWISIGWYELTTHPDKYKQYEAQNGWGTIEGCRNFFKRLLMDYDNFCYEYPELVNVVTFWIE